MSLVQEMLDRLSGVAALRDRLNDVRATLQDHQGFLLDHERRLARLEGGRVPPGGARPRRARTPA
jgi:hypothetical protein